MENEIWKDIESFPRYQISSEGNVRHLLKDGRIKIKLTTTSKYLKVNLSRNGENYTRYIHRLIAQAFIPNPENKPQVNHIDGNKHNNSIDNLEWSTCAENMNHAWGTGLMAVMNMGYVTKELYNEMLAFRSQGLTMRGIAKTLKVSQITVWRHLNRKGNHFSKTPVTA